MTVALLPYFHLVPKYLGALLGGRADVSPLAQSYLGAVQQLICNILPRVSGEQSLGTVLLGDTLHPETGTWRRSPYSLLQSPTVIDLTSLFNLLSEPANSSSRVT